jgi:hypothetical protein
MKNPKELPKQKYKYIGECNGNNQNGCFLDSPGHDCGCFTRVVKDEPKKLTDLEILIKLEEIEREEWEQEQDKNKYSEDEVLEQLNILMSLPSSTLDKFTDDNGKITMKWFEQFKKK